MLTYSFDKILLFFSEKLDVDPPPEVDIQSGKVELFINQIHVTISQGRIEGSLTMSTDFGLIPKHISEPHAKELLISNFLGIHTGGCTFALNEEEKLLELRLNITPITSLQESLDSLYRLISVRVEWEKTILKWEEFIPFYEEIIRPTQQI
ncbi:MAG: type III secretion system chaperone [Chlamydiales bacterium]